MTTAAASKLPTLLVAGSLRLAPEAEPAEPGETPIGYVTRWLRRRMPEFGGRSGALADRVLALVSKTGSGKSTVLPVAVFRLLRSEAEPRGRRYRGAGVVCTQPRVLTAIALAGDVSSERMRRVNPDMVLGETVGYQTGPVSNRPGSGLVYATAGVLAAQLQQQEDGELMERYRFVIVDEAHERSLDSDVTLMLLRNFYERNAGNPRLPFLLLASATFDPARYAAYFGVGPANVVHVEGRAFPIATVWPARGANDYPAAAVAKVVEIHEANPGDAPERADILVFVPGADGAKPIEEGLAKANRKYTARDAPEGSLGPLLVLGINREVVVSQTGAFALLNAPPASLPAVGGRRPARRVYVATVVAETGLTIETLKYLVDCGWSRTREVYQPLGAEGIVTRPAPRSRVEQRKGRVGRLFPGEFHPLYTENVHGALDAQQLPDIIATGYDRVHLAAVREQQRQKLRTGRIPEFRVEDVTLLDPPPPEAFLAANAAAVALGFVSARAVLPARWPPEVLETLEPPPADRRAAGGPAPPAGSGESEGESEATGSGAAPGAGAGGPEAGLADLRGEPRRGYGLTALGHVAAQFARTPMEGVRVLLAGYTWGAAASDLATAVALFGTPADDLLAPAERRRKPGPAGLPPGAAALRAALPPYLVERTGGGRVGGGGAPQPPAESEIFYFRARLLLADDFAEAVLVFDAFARRLDAAGGAPGPAAAWCAEAGLSFEALAEAARRREGVLEEMVIAGLNPYRAADRRLAALPAGEFTEGVARLKRCLYDGLRPRLLRHAPEHHCYVTRQGLRVRVPPLLGDAAAGRMRALGIAAPSAPRWLLTDLVRLVPAAAAPGDRGPPLLYAAAANYVSVLDGYVPVDPDFDGPRAF